MFGKCDREGAFERFFGADFLAPEARQEQR